MSTATVARLTPVKVDDLDPLKLANLVEVEVVGDDAAGHRLSEHHQPLVDFLHLAQLGQVGLVYL